MIPIGSRSLEQLRETFATDAHLSSVVTAAGTVVFLVPGGDTYKGAYVERARVPDTPEIAAGKEYIVFLDWYGPRNAHIPIFDFSGVFEVQGEQLVPYGKAVGTMSLVL